MLFIKIPYFFIKIEDIRKKLRSLIRPYAFIISENFFKDTMNTINGELEQVNLFFLKNPSVEKLEIKTKFKNLYRAMKELSQVLSFNDAVMINKGALV